jgi:hypothetical protein
MKKTWLLLYDLVDDYVARRAPLREAHLALARAALDRGELRLGGAFGNEIDAPSPRADGALLVFTAETSAAAERFVAADPYVKEGLVTRWRVLEWKVAIGTL